MICDFLHQLIILSVVFNYEKKSLQRPLLNYYSHVLFEDQLLEGLSNWLDRLFEGSTHRYYINYWPDWPGK